MTGYKSKRAAAQDKVTDIDGHVVRNVRKPRKLPQRPWVDHEPDGRMAAQKFIEAENKKVNERYGYVPKLHPSEWQDKLAQLAQDSNWAWMYPDALCDRACLYVCTKAFTQFPECATAPPQPTVQVSPLEFVEMVMDKEHLVGNPIVWAQWPNKEKNNG